jgi:hypothetical protein
MSRETKSARAYYIGAFSVGGPLMRVKIVERVRNAFDPDEWLCAVSSPFPRSSAWAKGSRVTAAGHDLFDHARYIPGPRVAYDGQSWRDRIAEGHYARDLRAAGKGPLFTLTRAGSEV